jgi:hypothetical protein
LAAKTRADLLKRLDPYWKMEAANVVFVPVFLIWLAGGKVGWISLVPIAATVLLLVIAAISLINWLIDRSSKLTSPDTATLMAERTGASMSSPTPKTLPS